jgi:distribution and morphology protein 10
MWGVRVLHNFGRLANEAIDAERVARKERERGTKRVDEEERMEGGLKGRLSAGAELYFSLKEKSAGGMCVLAACPAGTESTQCPLVSGSRLYPTHHPHLSLALRN